MKKAYDVIIAGGGVIGAAIAWRLGQAGQRVLLLEKAEIGRGASGAAAGMLGAQLEMDTPGPFYQLGLESRALYREFSGELYEETGIDIEWTDNGVLRLAQSEEGEERLRKRGEWQRASGSRAEWMTSAEVNEREKLLKTVYGGLFLPDDGNVSAPLLARALGVAAKRRADVLEGTEVLSYRTVGDEVSVYTLRESFHAKHFVLAAGAWVDHITGYRPASISVDPVKGQLLSLRPTGGHRLQRTVFTDDHVYMVPKRDGTVVVGATEEFGVGFQNAVTIAAIRKLLAAACSIAPSLSEAAFERAWVGFRPQTPTYLPYIGSDPVYPQLIYALGHYRNGILLAPITAKMVADAVLNREWQAHWHNFSPVYASS